MEFSKSRMVKHEGVTIEKNCCIKHEGKQFCAIGAVISEKYIVAYLSSDGQKITNWDGTETLTQQYIKLTDKWTNYGKGFYIRFKYNGKVYSGFCLGEGALIKARLTKLQYLNA